MRMICVYQEFLTGAHRAQIQNTAEAQGFVPRFFTLDQFEEAKHCLQSCEVLYAHSADLLREAPASLSGTAAPTPGWTPTARTPASSQTRTAC